jgi:signal transduction histidine kinase
MPKSRWFSFDGIMAWVTISGVTLVGLSILTITLLESRIIDRAGAHNRQVAFLLLSESVSKMIDKAGGIRETTVLEELIHNIRAIRPGILRISVFEVTPQSSSLLVSTDPKLVPKTLDPLERAEIAAGRSIVQLDESFGERAWRISAPITIDGKVVGALRGLFSVKEYDELIKQEIDVAKAIGIAVIVVTSITFLMLIRVKVHRPAQQLLSAMRSVETGDLLGQAPVIGPAEIQELATQFNRMLERVREAGVDKDRLLEEVRHLNETLQNRIADATTELERTNLELVEARLAIERSQRLAVLGELSAMVAHELGNPLNALSGHLQMLNHADDPAKRQHHLTVIRSEVDRMVAIIKQLLAQTHVPLRSAPVDLNTTIHEVLTLLSPGLSRQRVTIKTDLQKDLLPVVGDARALHGLLFNLVTNAKQAMPFGGELTIRTRVQYDATLPGVVTASKYTQTDNTVVRLTISDTGKGISPEHLSRIFEPFFTTRQEQGGTGLGLAICHRVVTDSGGRLAVKSDVGQGTEFTVDLPIWNIEQKRRSHQ